MALQMVIWTSLFLHCSASTFFDFPGNPDKPIYSEITHEDLLEELAGKRDAVEDGEELFNMESAVSKGISISPFSPLKVEMNGDNYKITSGEKKPNVQSVLDKMFGIRTYDLKDVTKILKGEEIKFESLIATTGGVVTVVASNEKIDFHHELKLTKLKIIISWKDSFNLDTKELGGNPDAFTIENIAIKISAIGNVNGQLIDFEAEKPMNEKETFVISKYDTLGKVEFNIIDFLGDFLAFTDATSFASNFEGTRQETLSAINYKDGFFGFGYMDFLGGYQLILRSNGSISDSATFGGGSPDLKVVIDREDGKGVNFALVAQFGSTDPVYNAVKSIVISNRDEDLFKRIKNRDYCLTISKVDLNISVQNPILEKYKNAFIKCYPTEFQEKTLKLLLNTGVATQVEMSLKDEDNCMTKARTENTGDATANDYKTATLTGVLTATGITWKYPKSQRIDMKTYLKCVSGDGTMFDLPGSMFTSSDEDMMYIYDLYQEPGLFTATIRFQPTEKTPDILPRMNITNVDLTYEMKYKDKKVPNSDDGKEAERQKEKKKEELEAETNKNKGKEDKKLKIEKRESKEIPNDDDGIRGNKKQKGIEEAKSNKNKGKEVKKKELEITHSATITIDLVGENGENYNFMCTAGYPFNDFECTMVIASLTMAEMLAFSHGKEKAENITKEESILNQKLINTGLKNIELSFASSGSSKKLSFTTQVCLGTYCDIGVELVYFIGYGVAFGCQIENLDMEFVIQSFLNFTGLNISIPWLNNIEGYFVASNIDLDTLIESEKEEKSESASEGSEGESEPSRRDFLSHIRKRSIPNTISKRPKNLGHLIPKYSLTKRENDESKKDGNKDKKKKDDGNNKKEEDDEIEEEYKFKLPMLQSETFAAGCRLEVAWKIPTYKDQCKNDSICKLLVEKVSGSKIYLGGGYFKKNESIYLKAGIDMQIPLNKDKSLTLEGAMLQIGWGKSIKQIYIKVTATMKYTTETVNLKFIGSVCVAATMKLEFEFAMQGFVYEPLGAKYFAFGDLFVGIQLDIAKGKFELRIGATIGFGKIIKPEKGKPRFDSDAVYITGFVGIDAGNFANSWVFAEIKPKLTLGQVCKAFGKTISDTFAEDGFHKGIALSYSNEEQVISSLSRVIPSGIRVVGGFKFAFMASVGDFNIDYPNGKCEITVDFDPISLLGGLIEFTSTKDHTKGPHFYLKLDLEELQDTQIKMFARLFLFGYGVGVTIEVNSAKIHIRVDIELGFFMASLDMNLYFGYTAPVKSAVKLSLKTTGFQEKLQAWIKKAILGVQEEAQKVDTKTKDTEKKANETQTDAVNLSGGWQKKIDDWEKKISDKKKKLEEESKQSGAQYDTCMTNCPEGCVGFFNADSCCKKWWGVCFPCVYWDKCFTKVRNPFCVLGCELKWLGNAILGAIKKGINKLESALQVVAKGLSKVVEAFKNVVEALGEALKNLKTFVLNVVAVVLEKILELLDFKIRQLELLVEVGRGFLRICFSYAYDIEFFGTNHTANHGDNRVCLDELLVYIVKELFGVSPRLKKHNEFIEKKDEVEGKISAVKEAEDDVEKSEKSNEQEIDVETGKEIVEVLDKNKKIPDQRFYNFVDEMKNKYKERYSPEELQFLNTPHMHRPYRRPEEVYKEVVDENSHWHMAKKSVENFPKFKLTLANSTDDLKRSLIFGESMSPCDRVRRSLSNYASLTNGLLTNIRHLEDGKVFMKTQRREHINDLNDVYKETQKLGTKYTNYSPEQKRDINYWYEMLKKDNHEYQGLVKRSYLEHERSALPNFKAGLDEILGEHVGSSFEDYTNQLHQHAIDGFKRSNIPTPNDGETLLHGIKRNLTLIVTNEEYPLTHMKRHLGNINEAIRTVNKHVMQC